MQPYNYKGLFQTREVNLRLQNTKKPVKPTIGIRRRHDSCSLPGRWSRL